jgi:hypothetical protein|tara:strand:+ start:533 stop:1033 length:501 start_codon:yes stop_codon:yes gene_type:complete
MRNTVVAIVFCLMSTFVFSQKLESSIIASQGGFDSTNFISLEWTLGENVVETVTQKSRIISQGFHQTYFSKSKVVRKKEMFEYPLDIIAYPNPVQSTLHLYLNAVFESQLNVDLYDITGKKVMEFIVNQKENNVSYEVEGLSSGIYLLRVSNSSGLLLKTHKIVKN